MNKSIPQYLIVFILLVAVWKFAWDYMEETPEPTIRAVGDIWDLRVYYNDGKWFPDEKQPYKDVPSVYPQVATFVFGIVHWFGRNELRAGAARETYFHMFSLFMICLTYLNFVLLSNMLQNKKWLALFLFLPGPLYFTLYRFDALPTFFTLLAFYVIRKKNWIFAAVLLGIATFTKWYAILLLPPLIVHIWSMEDKFPWLPIFAYLITCILILMPTFLGGGSEAVLVPYRFHSGRGIEEASLPGFLQQMTGNLLSLNFMIYLFLVLEVIASIILFFIYSNTYNQFEISSAIIIGCFVIFSRIFSPQWILWVLPLLILTARTSIDVVLIGLYGVLVYYAFPIVYDANRNSLPLINLISLIPLFILTLRLIMRIEWKFAWYPLFGYEKTSTP